MRKGFTLIELLAVIVILAIIALIATPIVLNIINETKENASLRSAEMYLNAVEYAIADIVTNKGGLSAANYYITPQGNLCEQELVNNKCSVEEIEIKVKGEKPKSGKIEIKGIKINTAEVVLSEKTIKKTEEGKIVFADTQEQNLAPGLYDENDNLVYTWEELMGTNITYEDSWGEEITSPILSVDENGVLYTNFDFYQFFNFSEEYLVGKLVISNTVTTIGDEGLCSLYNLTSITIPNSVTTIGGHAFEFNELTNIIIPNSVTTIESAAFAGNQLTNIIIPNSVTTIGDYAFKNNKLTSVIIKGKSSFADFQSYGKDVFEWAEGYSDANIIWQP